MGETGFKSNFSRGWHMTFANGWTISVVYGAGSYSSNRDADFTGHREREWESPDAEVWTWEESSDKNYPKAEPFGWQTPDQVLALMLKTAARKPSKVKVSGG